MGTIDILWAIGLFVAALGVAVLAFTPAELQFARWCFWGAAALIIVSQVMWQLSSDQPLGLKVVAAAVVGAFAFGGLAAGLGWINNKEKTNVAGPNLEASIPQFLSGRSTIECLDSLQLHLSLRSQ